MLGMDLMSILFDLENIYTIEFYGHQEDSIFFFKATTSTKTNMPSNVHYMYIFWSFLPTVATKVGQKRLKTIRKQRLDWLVSCKQLIGCLESCDQDG